MKVSAARLLIIIAVGGAFTCAFWVFRTSHEQRLRIDLVGYTNHFRGMGREAIIAVTNQSDATFILTILRERKNPEWPIHSRIYLNPDAILPAHSATNFPVRLQPNDGIWRVRVLYRNPPITRWQGTRSRWSRQLKVRNWHRLAALIEPELAKAVLTPEMEL